MTHTHRLNATLTEAEAEAAVWLARLHADDKTKRDERAFRKWLESDPANKEAFGQIASAWDIAGGAQRNPYEIEAPRRWVGRREVLAGLGATVALVGGTGYWQTAIAGVHQTDLGEQKHVTLDDGTLLLLDTDTKVRVHFSSAERQVDLVRGRCNFRVAADTTRPFVVEAAEQRIVAPRANFDVRRDGERVQVVCLSGNATVATAAYATAGQLKAGERLTAPAGEAPRIDVPDLGAMISWQTGQLIFDDQPLGEAVGEMNRYSTAKLIVTDPRAANLRLSGVYRAGDNVAFARSIARLLPIRTETSDGVIRISGAA